MRTPGWPRPQHRDKYGFADWQALVRFLGGGLLGAVGVLLLFGNSPREAFFVGLGLAAMFAIFSWLAGEPRWTWAKAAIASLGMVLSRSLGVHQAESEFAAGALREGVASGAGSALVLVWLAWRVHQRPERTAAG
ncbi:MAG: hypothetical protein H0U10_13310 [Chloroflexia bacterium]|nr:hypothetical protein [Chloroflexia bacterium]